MAAPRALIDLLTRAVRDGTLTEAEAVTLLKQYGRRGVRVRDNLLSLPASEAIATRLLPLDIERGEIRARSLLGLGENARITRLSDAVKARAVDAAQARFEREAKSLAGRLANGSLSVREWHAKQGALTIQHMVEQATLGAGRRLTPSELARLAPEVQKQTLYLSRFADKVSVSKLAGQPMSAEAVASRAQLYAGAARGEHYKAKEQQQGDGYIYEYISRDDGGTCSNCYTASRNGPYLAGVGPMPGQVCRGRGRCRCRREARYAPEEAARIAA